MKEKVERMKRDEVEGNNLQQLTFTDKEFPGLNFHDDGNELEFAGKMYDIVKIKNSPGKKIIYCLTDARETQLKILAKKQQQQKNISYKNLLAKIYIPSKNLAVPVSTSAKKNIYSFFIPADRICSASYDILKPPPQTA